MAKSKVKLHQQSASICDQGIIDEFWRDPSPQELTTTSGIRIRAIVHNLQRRTAEELQNWLCGLHVRRQTVVARANSSKTQHLLDEEVLVRSPVSLMSMSPRSLRLDPNLCAESGPLYTDYQIRNTYEDLRPTSSHPGRHESSFEAAGNAFSTLDKPSFQSFLKKVATIPPPQSGGPKRGCESLCSRADTTERLNSRQLARRRIKSATAVTVLTFNPSSYTCLKSQDQSRCRSVISPVKSSTFGARNCSVIRRKPLPQGSQLFVSLTGRPAVYAWPLKADFY